MNPQLRPDPTALAFRAQVLRNLREFFHRQGVLEVETPVLSRGISLDCHIDVFSTCFHPLGYPRASQADGETFYLQTSPEPHMKRLLSRGFPDIYQICKAFRNGERGVRHNPEFTMLEWYRKDFSLADLMSEVEAVCILVAGPRPVTHRTYREAFQEAVGADPLELDLDGILTAPGLRERLPAGVAFVSKADALDFIMAHLIEPGFPPGELTFVRDFPAEQAAQSQVHPGDSRLAQRFEVYGGGMELGNGYLELTDPKEYSRRFELENVKRREHGKPELPTDERLSADLRLGLPPCAGVAVGVDRLVQLGLGRADVASVFAFPWDVA